MIIRRAGDRALLCDVADVEAAHGLRAAITAAAYDDVIDVVPGWRSVLVILDAPTDLESVAARLRALRPQRAAVDAVSTHVISVTYDGPDLELVAAHARLSIDEVVRRHAARTYTVAFLGFQPGFAYLVGLDPKLATPRKETPRTSVPSGAVGIAGDVTGIYPRTSPGGWQLIGSSDASLFDVEKSPPALFGPGDRVRFEARE
ncbi:MAG: 5-oxoprolinase subunit PxpB [Actinomycetes bacterium]